MNSFQKNQSAKILASYGINIQKSEDENDLEKSEGSRGGKVIGHTKSGKAIYDSFDPGKQDFVELVKSEEDNDLIKGKKPVAIGTHSKDGKSIKVQGGWEKIHTSKQNGGQVEEHKTGSASLGQFKDHSHEDLSKLNETANKAKEKNNEGKTLSKEEQHALDNHADIKSVLEKKKPKIDEQFTHWNQVNSSALNKEISNLKDDIFNKLSEQLKSQKMSMLSTAVINAENRKAKGSVESKETKEKLSERSKKAKEIYNHFNGKLEKKNLPEKFNIE
jgi:hypothetical protein